MIINCLVNDHYVLVVVVVIVLVVDDSSNADNGPWTIWSLDYWTIDNHYALI